MAGSADWRDGVLRTEGPAHRRTRGATCIDTHPQRPPSNSFSTQRLHPPSFFPPKPPVLSLNEGCLCSCVVCCIQDLSQLASLLSSSTYYEVRVNAASMLGLAGARPDVVEDVAKALTQSLANEAHVMVEAEVSTLWTHIRTTPAHFTRQSTQSRTGSGALEMWKSGCVCGL